MRPVTHTNKYKDSWTERLIRVNEDEYNIFKGMLTPSEADSRDRYIKQYGEDSGTMDIYVTLYMYREHGWSRYNDTQFKLVKTDEVE